MPVHNQNVDQKDLFRNTPIRYLGYANEVGEAFRSHLHINWVRFSYGVASAYVLADAIHKGNQAKQLKWADDSVRKTKVLYAVLDTLIWQGLASVIIPGFTINRICWASEKLLQRARSLPAPTRKWIVTAIGLSSIPFIIKPIDSSVDILLERTLRKWSHIEPVLETDIVHHKRND